MRALELKEGRSVRFPNELDLYGRPASLAFSRYDKPGVFWRTKGGDWPINLAGFAARKRLLRLVEGADYLDVAEHILPIVHAPFTRLLIEGTGRTPCFGRTSEIYDALVAASIESGDKTELYTVSEGFSHVYGIGGWRKFVVEPTKEPFLRIDVTIDFKDIGRAAETYVFPNRELLARVLKARTLGLPPWYDLVRSYPEWSSRMMKRINLPLIQTAVWKGEVDTETLLATTCDHRAQDLLGGIGLIVPPGGILAGMHIRSECVGHAAEARGVTALRGKVVPFK